MLIIKLIFTIFLLTIPQVSLANTDIISFRTADKKDFSRFVLDISTNPQYEIFVLQDPMRVVIDLKDTKWNNSAVPHSSTKRIKAVRYAEKNGRDLRIVLDINQPVSLKKIFVLQPDGNNPHRLVIDMQPDNELIDIAGIPSPTSRKGMDIAAPKPKLKTPRKPLIVIDAGHGGHDPGSIGRKKTKEKNITLKYAKALKRELLKTGKYKVHLTRSTDKYIKLRQRVNIARRVKGDLFVSVHADSHRNKRVRGLSVYTLSENASDKEAAALAAKENKSDIINGVDLGMQISEVSALLIDMVQRDTKNVSSSFAETLVKNLKKKTKLLRNPHRFAGFRVLTGADIPSVLVELGYLSNRKEEKLLNSKKHKNKLAKAVARAIDSHFKKYKIE